MHVLPIDPTARHEAEEYLRTLTGVLVIIQVATTALLYIIPPPPYPLSNMAVALPALGLLLALYANSRFGYRVLSPTGHFVAVMATTLGLATVFLHLHGSTSGANIGIYTLMIVIGAVYFSEWAGIIAFLLSTALYGGLLLIEEARWLEHAPLQPSKRFLADISGTFSDFFINVTVINLCAVVLGIYIARALRRHRERADRTNQELEERVQERTAELARANDELTTFVRSLAHDLKEPLRALEAFTGFLRADCWDHLDDTGHGYVDRMTGSVGQMKQRLTDVQQLARLRRDPVELHWVSLTDILESARDQVSYRLEEKQARLALPDACPEIYGDAKKLVQVFANLLSNAAKYHKPGQAPDIAVSWREADEGIEVAVTDDGIGIDPRYHQRVFEPFRRLQSEGEADGSGMGLSIVERLVLQHGGRVSIDSQLGKGTTISVVLPAGEVARNGSYEVRA